MHCSSCRHDNPDKNRFCEACGVALPEHCTVCGAEIGSASKYCGSCGAARHVAVSLAQKRPEAAKQAQYPPPRLVERILAEQALMEARGVKAGERKMITALFADLVGSTRLMAELDPEEARQVIDPVLSLMIEAVHHYEGYVAKSLGDGILALFGAPIAHEDHAQRALYAALRMQAMMGRQLSQLSGSGCAGLQIRVGVNSGEVVVRAVHKDSLHTDYDPVGNSVNVASRLQSIAAPGTILVSESTHRLTEAYFTFSSPQLNRVKGLAGAVQTFKLTAPGMLKSRFQASQRRGLSQFVGRKNTLAQLGSAFQSLREGRGQIIGVVGDPGVGKSRLLHEFKRLVGPDCLVLEAFSVSHGKAFPYLPLIELLQSFFQLTSSESEAAGRDKVHKRLFEIDLGLTDIEPYLLHLLGLCGTDRNLVQMDSQLRRQRTCAAIRRMLQALSKQQPILLIFEDLQWLDIETQGFLNSLAEEAAQARILLVVNYRPEHRHQGSAWPDYTELCLSSLDDAEAGELLTSQLGRDPALSAIRSLILEKSGGNPFFIEELVQSLCEQGVLRGVRGDLRPSNLPSELSLPANVQGILSARMDRLPLADKTLLQILAVLGKSFPLNLAQQVSGEAEDPLRQGLDRLRLGQYIYEYPSFPEIEYGFRHALTQQVAYDSLLGEQRTWFHERAGNAIERLYADHLDEYYNELAHHYSRSQNTPKALVYLKNAAYQAQKRSGHREALEYLKAALALLPSLPEADDRREMELDLLLAAGTACLAVKGFAAAEVEDIYSRALTLSRQVRKQSQLFSALFGLRLYYHGQGRFETAVDLAQQLVDIATRAKDPDLLLEGRLALGCTLMHMGRLGQARRQLEEVSRHYSVSEHRGHALHYGMDPGVTAFAMLARVLWYLGFPEQALVRAEQAIELAKELASPYELAFALVFTAEVYQHCQLIDLAIQSAESAISISEQQGFTLWLRRGHILRGSLVAEGGELKEGLEEIEHWLDAYREAGVVMWQPLFIGLQVELLGRAGRTDEALAAAEVALALTGSMHELICLPELLRLKAQLLLQRNQPGDLAGAENALRQALDTSRQLSARSLALRAAIALGLLLGRSGRGEEGQLLLNEVYGGFREGFNTGDLQQAYALLHGRVGTPLPKV